VLVADSGNKRVTIFSKDGAFLKGVAAPSRGGIVATPDGSVYVSDVNAGAVTVLRQDQIVEVIKVDGRPHGLAVDPRTGDVYTSSTLANQWNVSKTSLKKATVK
jgi:DNA-binding beta-propeller fold protein YncE